MNAPAIFLITPLFAAAVAYVFFPHQPRLTTFASILFSLLLAVAASFIPLGAAWVFLGHPLPVSNTLLFLGRPFIFNPEIRPIILFLCLGSAALLAGSLAASGNRLLVPVLLVVLEPPDLRRLFIQPFLYASFFLLLSVILLALLLSDASHPSPRGAVRWISYSVLGTLFLLLAGSAISLYSNLPADPAKMGPILVQLCLGFGLLLSFPPFHFWLPDVADDSPPYSVSLVLSLYVGGVIFILLRFLDGFAWLRQSSSVYLVFLLAGQRNVRGGRFSLLGSKPPRALRRVSIAVQFGCCFSEPIHCRSDRREDCNGPPGRPRSFASGLGRLFSHAAPKTVQRPNCGSARSCVYPTRWRSPRPCFPACRWSAYLDYFPFPAFYIVLRSVEYPGSPGRTGGFSSAGHFILHGGRHPLSLPLCASHDAGSACAFPFRSGRPLISGFVACLDCFFLPAGRLSTNSQPLGFQCRERLSKSLPQVNIEIVIFKINSCSRLCGQEHNEGIAQEGRAISGGSAGRGAKCLWIIIY